MNRLELIGGILSEIGVDPNMDRILAQSALIVLNRITVAPQPAPEPEPEPEPGEPAPDPVKEKPKRGRKPFDVGKLRALREGGWSVAKIADEMRVSEQTIRNHMKKQKIS